MSLEGQQIGRYRILRLLGSGGMGNVYLAEDAHIEQQVAIKVLKVEEGTNPNAEETREAARLFEREVKAIARLDHPHILPLFNYGEEHTGDTTFVYLVMPYRQEGSLATWLRQRDGRLLPLEDVAYLIRQAADALQHAHNRHLIHQDVKPSNFLIRSREETPNHPDLLLTDFGIARFATATSGVSQSVRGTPTYMASEQWEGEPVPATDQYALAVMAYELLTGRPPFQGGPGRMMYQHLHVTPTPPSTLNPRLSQEIDTVLLHALAKRPEMRFASVTAFATALQQAAQGITVVVKPAGESLLTSNVTGSQSPALTANVKSAQSRVSTSASHAMQAQVDGALPTSTPNQPMPVQRQRNKTLPLPNADSPLSTPQQSMSQQLPQRRYRGRTFALPALLILLVLLLPLGYFLLPFSRGGVGSPHPAQNVLPQLPAGIGVVKAPNGEYIGISDGSFAFDTNRLDGGLKRQAAEKLKANDLWTADYLWGQAITKDTNDAETLIYKENQHVLDSGRPHITIVVGITITGPATTVSVGRENLLGAYVAQKEYNSQLKLPGGMQVFLLIANSGSNPSYATQVAQQIVRLAQTDKTIVGLAGWSSGEQALNALRVLAPAHIPMASNAAADSLTGRSPYFFRVVAPAKIQGQIGAGYVEKTLHAKTAALFVDTNDGYSRSLADSFTKRFTGDGNSLVATEKYTVGRAGTIPQLLQDALSKHPGVIYFAGTPREVGIVLAHLRPSDPPVMGGNPLYQLQGYSPAARVGLSHLHFTAGSYPDEWDILGLVAQKPSFFADYKSYFDPRNEHSNAPYEYDRPQGSDMLFYDALSVLLYGSSIALTEKSSFTGNDLQQALTQVTGKKAFQGVSGAISFGPDGNAINKATAILCVDKDKHFKLDWVQGQFLVGEDARAQFPASSVCG